MRLSRKGNCPHCNKALRNGKLYVHKGLISHFACVYPPLPLPSNPLPHSGTRYAPSSLSAHDAE